MNTVMRTQPLEGGPESAIWSKDFAIRKRQDGGYTIASGHENIVDIVPKSFRYAFQFLPALKMEWRSLSFRLGGRFFDEMRMPTRWNMDEASPFEYNRVLDPKPSLDMSSRAFDNLKSAFPVFNQAQVAQRWAGYIDVTPDAVPVISAVDQIPDFILPRVFQVTGLVLARRPAASWPILLLAVRPSLTRPISDFPVSAMAQRCSRSAGSDKQYG